MEKKKKGKFKISKKIRYFLLAAAVVIVILGIKYLVTDIIPGSRLKRENVASVKTENPKVSQGEIKKHSGDVLVAESESKSLFIDTDTCDLKIKDKESGLSYHAIYPKNSGGSSEKCLLAVTFLGEDNVIRTWDSYQYAVSLDEYQLNQIENGVKITLHMNEGESIRLYDYLPQKLTIERYEQFFVQGLKDLVANQTLDEATAEKYQSTLSLIYVKNEMENCYAVNYVGTPPTSAVKQLIEVTKCLGYTSDMLLEDCQVFNLTPPTTEKASFNVVMDAYLDGDDFVVNLPSAEQVNENEYYQISNIKLLPNFMTATTSETEEGYMFVPDGSGALIKMYEYDPAITDYKMAVYNNNYFTNYFFAPEYKETIHMPVFGMFYGSLDAPGQGFLAIIESGAETAYIHAKTGAVSLDAGGSPYNKVCASIDNMQANNIKVFGPYEDSTATYLAKTDTFKEDYRIRYRLFAKNGGYYQMAKSYQNYLMNKLGIDTLSYKEQPQVFLDVLGTFSITKRILGIPYQSNFSMTTYKELMGIMDEMKDCNTVIQYDGALNNGMYNEAANQAKLVSANGSKKEFQALCEKADSYLQSLYLGANFLHVYQKGNGYKAKSKGLYNYYNEPANIYRYFLATGYFNELSYPYSVLSPAYLSSVTDAFIKDSKDLPKIAVNDMAYDYLADYHDKKMVSPYDSFRIVDENLQKLSTEKDLVLVNPRMDYLGYGSIASGIDRKSSNYASIYETIPFRQLVMNGLIDFTTADVNMNSNDAVYYVLQAMEFGAIPKYTLTAKSSDDLRDTYYSNLYSTEFSNYEPKIKSMYEEIKKAYDEVGTFEIINHEILAKGVFRTTYASGYEVIVNYNDFNVTLADKTIAARSYEWRKKA